MPCARGRARSRSDGRRNHQNRSVYWRGERDARQTSGDHVRLLERAPDIDHRLPGKIELAIAGVRRAEDEEIALRDHGLKGHQVRVGGDKGIGGQHRGRMARQRLLEFVAQRGAGIVDVGLERHTEQADLHVRQLVAPREVVADVQHQPFVDQHGGVAQAKLVLCEGRQLHGVLHQAGASGEARRGDAARARIVVAHGVVDAPIVDACGLGDLIELVRGRELDIAIGIVEQLRELSLPRRDPHQLRGDRGKQLGRGLLRLGRRAADDLRHVPELLDAIALNDALRTEGELEVAAHALEVAVEPVSGAGKDRRAEHQQLSVGEMRQQRVNAVLHHLAHRIEELVDRRADGDDDRPLDRDVRGRGGEQKALGLERPRKQLLSAMLDEREAAGLEGRQHVLIEIVDVDSKSRLGECEDEGDADMATAAHDRQVGVIELCAHRSGRLGTGKIHAGAPAVRVTARAARARA